MEREVNLSQIEDNVSKLTSNISIKSFIYDLLIAYGMPKSAITRLKQGTYNLSKNKGEILWKKKLFFKEVKNGDLHHAIDESKNNLEIRKQDPRFIVVTDYKLLLAIDTKTLSSLDIDIAKLNKHFDFFLPWAGLEKASLQIENPADVKAAEKMAKLYDQILSDNPSFKNENLHALNVFLSRLLFCYFAEDTGIFESNLFTGSISSHTQPNGSDLCEYLEKVFDVLNTRNRRNLPKYLEAFPYVNGGLLGKKYSLPKFTTRSRRLLIECGELDWSEINPDIFGSMIQAVVHSNLRTEMGVHYTSVPNIMKVIEPLFLTKLRDEFEKSLGSIPKLNKLRKRLKKLRIVDPACGSGNFLVIAYKELRKLEIEIIEELGRIQNQTDFPFPEIKLSQFFGIELDDFAHEIAMLSLWLADHQMNMYFKSIFGHVHSSLPLNDAGVIVCGNAAKLDWDKVFPKEDGTETYVLGNPPYLGFSLQNESHKEDLRYVVGGPTKLDYISCWFLKGASFISKREGKLAFVSTNSICQGEHVGLLWPEIFRQNLEIKFAHRSFKWKNNAKKNAAVICVVVGLGRVADDEKFLFDGNIKKLVKQISPYLTENVTSVVEKRNSPISNIPDMVLGNMPKDGGHLFLSDIEKNSLVTDFPSAKKFIRRALGSFEFINSVNQWCLWISDSDVAEASKIPPIKDRIEQVKKMRLASKKKGTQKYAKQPHRFVEIRHQEVPSIIFPRVSSERREYIPIGFLEPSVIVKDLAYAIYDAEPWLFGVLSSKMHMAWIKEVGGRLKSDFRYSSSLCYNNFPIPEMSQKQKSTIQNYVLMILAEREKHPEKTLADLYDPKTMPTELKNLHSLLDIAIDSIYRSRPFSNDGERIAHLFKMYSDLTKDRKKES